MAIASIPPEQAAPRLGRNVFRIESEGVVRLLDFERGRFYALDRVGSRMLALCLEHGLDEAATRLAAEYDAAPEQIRADLVALLRDLESKQLLVPAHRPAEGHGRLLAAAGAGLRCTDLVLFRPLRAAAAMLSRLAGRRERVPAVPGPRRVRLLLTLAWISLRLFGWTGTLSLWRRWHRTDSALEPAARARVLEALDRVVREAAVRKLCFPSACKERALVGYQVLRAIFGLPAVLVVGVQCHPFCAHAWVECDGVVVTDDPDHCAMYTPFARYRSNEES